MKRIVLTLIIIILLSNIIITFNVKADPPYTPSNPNPTNHETNVDINTNLSWTGSDPDFNDTVTYDIYFGTTTPPIKIISNQSVTSYDPGLMNYNTVYYWKIIAWDNHGATTTGPVWDFTTTYINQPPNTPSNPNPDNHAMSVDIFADLSWTGGDPNTNDTITYDIYFGTSSNPPLKKSNHTTTSYDPGKMSSNAKYYWKIVSKDNHGESTTGPIWNFKTILVHTPPTADAGGPYSANINQTITFNASASTDTDGTIDGYRWDYNNDGVYDTSWSSSPTTTYIYTTAGTYTIKLQVKDNIGAAASDTALVIVSQGNIKLQADAGGPYYEIIGISFQFDGSDSYNLNGTILTYKWSFGDGNTSTSIIPTHTYTKEGNYTVILTITDNNKNTDIDITYAIVTKKPNHPPETPTISGIISSHINTNCDYIIKAYDVDDDKIQYIINWSDGTNQTISPLLNSNITFNTSHSWSTGGIYRITVYSLDENNATSENQIYTVLIDAYYCGSLGYLVDKNGDGTYDVFYYKTTGNETNIQKNNNEYNIDINNDQEWDYKFNLTTNKISEYKTSTIQESSISNIIPKGIPLIISVILLIIYLIFLLKKLTKIKNENQQEKKPKLEIKEKYSPAKTNKIYAFGINDEKTKKMHEEIDKILSNIDKKLIKKDK